MLKLGKKFNRGGTNMNKYDYEYFVTKIKLLELKLKRIALEKEHHATLKSMDFLFKIKKNGMRNIIFC